MVVLVLADCMFPRYTSEYTESCKNWSSHAKPSWIGCQHPAMLNVSKEVAVLYGIAVDDLWPKGKRCHDDKGERVPYFFFFKDVLFTNDGLFLDAVVKITIWISTVFEGWELDRELNRQLALQMFYICSRSYKAMAASLISCARVHVLMVIQKIYNQWLVAVLNTTRLHYLNIVGLGKLGGWVWESTNL